MQLTSNFGQGHSGRPGLRWATRAIVTLAESLGMDTTAEGVETHDDLQLIRELGVSQVQGYIFGKPVGCEQNATKVGGRVEGCVMNRILMRRPLLAGGAWRAIASASQRLRSGVGTRRFQVS